MTITAAINALKSTYNKLINDPLVGKLVDYKVWLSAGYSAAIAGQVDYYDTAEDIPALKLKQKVEEKTQITGQGKKVQFPEKIGRLLILESNMPSNFDIDNFDRDLIVVDSVESKVVGIINTSSFIKVSYQI